VVVNNTQIVEEVRVVGVLGERGVEVVEGLVEVAAIEVGDADLGVGLRRVEGAELGDGAPPALRPC
jgi:hypothetical protein